MKYPDYELVSCLVDILLVVPTTTMTTSTTTWTEILLNHFNPVDNALNRLMKCVHFCIEDKREASNRIHFGIVIVTWISVILHSVWKYFPFNGKRKSSERINAEKKT